MKSLPIALALFLSYQRWVGAVEWQSAQPLPTQRAFAESGTNGGEWVVAGGVAALGNGLSFPTEILAFWAHPAGWSSDRNLTIGRDSMSSASNSTRSAVIFSGGLGSGSGPDTILDETDLVLGDGRLVVGHLNSARFLHASAALGNTFMVSGGWSGPATISDDAEILEEDGHTWMSAGHMPGGPRAGHSMTTLADRSRVLVVGGCLTDHNLTDVDLYDQKTNLWRALPGTRVPRCRHTATLLGDGRVLIVGSLGNKLEPSSEIFDPATETWSEGPPLPRGLFDHKAVALPDGNVAVVGGSLDPFDGDASATSGAEVFDAATSLWRILPDMLEARRWPVVAFLGDGLYVGGGDNSSGALSSVERLDAAALGIGDRGSGCGCALSDEGSGLSVMNVCIGVALGAFRRRGRRYVPRG